VAIAQAGGLEAADLAPRQVRHVDVEDGIGWQRIGAQARDDLHRRARRGLVVRPLWSAVASDIATAGRPRKRPSIAAATVPGIDHVVAEVGGVVDAGDHDVRLEPSASSMPVSATCTQSVGVPYDLPGVRIELHDPDRRVQRQRVAGAGGRGRARPR
jgi:hypothetical protein